jgi:hypothetical protein
MLVAAHGYSGPPRGEFWSARFLAQHVDGLVLETSLGTDNDSAATSGMIEEGMPHGHG